MFRRCNLAVIVLLRVLILLGSLAVLGLMLNVVADVVGRFLFNRPMRGTIEYVSFWWMVPLSMFGFAVAQRVKEHIDVPLIFDRLQSRSQRLTAVLGNLLTAGFAGVIVFFGARGALRQMATGERTGATQVAIWPMRFIVPIAVGIFILQLLLDTLAALRGDESDAAGGLIRSDEASRLDAGDVASGDRG
jgi:TRAP-type C4-dicarboxylate transport system permease small subunit